MDSSRSQGHPAVSTRDKQIGLAALVGVYGPLCYEPHLHRRIRKIVNKGGARLMDSDEFVSKALADQDTISFWLTAAPTKEIKGPSKEVTGILVHSHFQQPFIGPALRDFLQVFHYRKANYNKTINNFGRIIPIVNSSGTGKSMLVEQLSYIQPVLSVCFRNNKDTTLAWPPGDDALWCYFKELGAENKFTEEEMFAALLGALVEEATESLVPHTSTLDSDHRRTFSGWDFGPPGSQAVKRCAHLSSAVERAKTRLRRHKSEATCPVLQPASSWHTSLFQQFCLPYFKTLAARLQNLGYEFAFIAFYGGGFRTNSLNVLNFRGC